MGKSSFFKSKLSKQIQYLLVELFIVFIGVYLAFQLNEFKSNRELEQREEQLQLALAQEIDIFIVGANQLIPELNSEYADWRQSYDSGELPRPLTYELGGADLPPRGMWQAVLASDGLAILPVNTMQNISQYYNALEILLGKYDELIQFSSTEILPFSDPNAFYDPETQQLLPKYVVYMRRFQDMVFLFDHVKKLAVKSKSSLTSID